MDKAAGCLIGRLDYCVDHWPLSQLERLVEWVFAD